MFYEVDKDALTLLRAMKEHYNNHNPETLLSEGMRLAPELVAKEVGLDTERAPLREGAEVFGWRGSPGVGGTPRQRTRCRLLPGNRTRAQVDVRNLLIFSVIIDVYGCSRKTSR